MTGDIGTIFDSVLLAGDLALTGPALAEDSGLTTAVVLSLFCDARALDGDRLPDGETDRRGFWGDLVAPAVPAAPVASAVPGASAEGDRFGSRLWLIHREKQTNETRNRAREYAEEALQWLIDDGVALAVSVVAEWIARGVLALDIKIDLADGAVSEHHFEQALGAV